ncbi:uncharacterized protein CLUP02_09521 [Colletotrichum lupini]|uniref:Uncharacterized protein n=1 Tax=Colletotrichum lupini TaxID=145971 RepID=A0A9Q8SVT6_9PEZI|nr:uncharacterized protein CLUP02_09521 [Colletotrichum lupini]UQC84025.1 hypothetical protein CLUP02_09521 [Colletotrichum lupini]
MFSSPSPIAPEYKDRGSTVTDGCVQRGDRVRLPNSKNAAWDGERVASEYDHAHGSKAPGLPFAFYVIPWSGDDGFLAGQSESSQSQTCLDLKRFRHCQHEYNNASSRSAAL